MIFKLIIVINILKKYMHNTVIIIIHIYKNILYVIIYFLIFFNIILFYKLIFNNLILLNL